MNFIDDLTSFRSVNTLLFCPCLDSLSGRSAQPDQVHPWLHRGRVRGLRKTY